MSGLYRGTEELGKESYVAQLLTTAKFSFEGVKLWIRIIFFIQTVKISAD